MWSKLGLFWSCSSNILLQKPRRKFSDLANDRVYHNIVILTQILIFLTCVKNLHLPHIRRKSGTCVRSCLPNYYWGLWKKLCICNDMNAKSKADHMFHNTYIFSRFKFWRVRLGRKSVSLLFDLLCGGWWIAEQDKIRIITLTWKMIYLNFRGFHRNPPPNEQQQWQMECCKE